MVNSRTTLIVAAIFLALMAFVFWDMTSLSEKRRAKEESAGKLLAETDRFVEWIEFSANAELNKPTIRVECREQNSSCSFTTNAKWEITAPEKTDADIANIGAALSTLQSAKTSDSIDIDEKAGARNWRTEFGLDKPLLVATIKFKDTSEPLRLEFGASALVGTDQYATSSREPKKVLSLPSYIEKALDRDLFYWRNKQFFPGIDINDVVKIRWKHSQVAMPIEVERSGRDWILNQPKKLRANALLVLGLANGIVNWSGRNLGNPKEALAKDATLTADFELKGGKKYHIGVFPLSDKTKFIAVTPNRPWRGEVNANEVSRYARSLPEIRDNQLLGQEEIERIQDAHVSFYNEGVATTLPLEKREGKWRAVGPGAVGLSMSKVEAFMALFHSSGVKYAVPNTVSEAMSWKKDFQVVVRFFDGKKELVREFKIYTDRKDSAFTDGELAGELRKLTPKFAKSIPLTTADLTEAAATTPAAAGSANDLDDHEHGH